MRPHRYRLLAREEVYALLARWAAGLTLSDTATQLGLSEEGVVALASEAMLSALRGPLADGSVQWLFGKPEVEHFQQSLIDKARAAPEEWGDLVDLQTVARMLATVGGNLMTVMEHTQQSQLTAYLPANSSARLVGNLLFRVQDVQMLVKAIRHKKGWLMLEDIAQRMQVKDVVVRRWVQNGLLRSVASHANTHYFSQAEVEQFMADHLFTEAAAEILQVGKLVVQKWARTGRLKAVSGPDMDGSHRYLFRRDEVDRLRPENRLTAPEVAKRLGISRSQLGEWIRQGRIVPVSGPGIDGAKHYLFVWQEG